MVRGLCPALIQVTSEVRELRIMISELRFWIIFDLRAFQPQSGGEQNMDASQLSVVRDVYCPRWNWTIQSVF